MADTEEIHTNEAGGKQSKLYRAYHLIDPYALEVLAAVHHRGSIKYALDNWRKIGTEEHLNHCLHHITQAMKGLLRARQGRLIAYTAEDDLGHALCRLTFAVAMEAQYHGDQIHREHSDPTYHEPKAPPAEHYAVRDTGSKLGSVPTTLGFDERARSFATLAGEAGRHDTFRAPQVGRSTATKTRTPTVHPKRRRR